MKVGADPNGDSPDASGEQAALITLDSIVVAEEETIRYLFQTKDNAPWISIANPIYENNHMTEGYIIREGTTEYSVFEQDGKFYLHNQYKPDNGRMYKQTDEEFYEYLADLFE